MRMFTVMLLSLFLFSCSMAPAKKDLAKDQKKKAPEKFAAQTDSVTEEEVSPYRWWERFNDDVLNEIVDKTIKNNLDIQLAISRVELLDSQFGVARRLRFPMVSAKAGGSYGTAPAVSFKNGQMGYESKASDSYTLNLGLSFELDIWGRLKSQEKSVVANLMATKEDMQTVYLSVISQAIILYNDIRELQAVKKYDRDLADIATKVYELNKQKYESGAGSLTDVEQSFQQLENAQATLNSSSSDLKKKMNSLLVLIGEYPKGFLETGNAELPDNYDPIPAGLPSTLLKNRPDIKSAEFKVEAARQDVGVARADLFPKISITGLLGYLNVMEFTKLFSGDFLTASGGADVNYSVAGLSKYAVVDQKFALYKQAELNYKKTVLNAFREVEDALLTVENADIQKDSALKRLESMEKIYDNAKSRYEKGVYTYSGLLELKKSIISMKKLNLTITKGAILSRVQLHRALGGNWIEKESGKKDE